MPDNCIFCLFLFLVTCLFTLDRWKQLTIIVSDKIKYFIIRHTISNDVSNDWHDLKVTDMSLKVKRQHVTTLARTWRQRGSSCKERWSKNGCRLDDVVVESNIVDEINDLVTEMRKVILVSWFLLVDGYVGLLTARLVVCLLICWPIRLFVGLMAGWLVRTVVGCFVG